MKKLLAVLAAVAIAGPALGVTVYSNTVGYIRIDTPAAGQLAMVAVGQLAPEGVDIQDAISNLADLNAGTVENYASADKIFLWTGEGYEAYGLFQPSEGEPYWMGSGEGAWTLAFLDGVPAVAVIEPSDGVWFRTGAEQEPKSAVLLGEVSEAATTEVDIIAGLNMLALPYSTDINLQDLFVDGAIAAGTGNYAAADKIFLWTGEGYEAYGLFQPSEGEPYWMGSGEGAWTLGFLDGVPADVDIDIGQGFWYRTGAATTIEFSVPYDL